MTHAPLSKERASRTHRVQIGMLKVYVTVGLYPDGRVGEIFLHANKQGSLERGLLHTIALLISVMLQNGIPLSKVIEKLRRIEFEPNGMTSNPKIPLAASIVDYLARWLEQTFMAPTGDNPEKPQ